MSEYQHIDKRLEEIHALMTQSYPSKKGYDREGLHAETDEIMAELLELEGFESTARLCREIHQRSWYA